MPIFLIQVLLNYMLVVWSDVKNRRHFFEKYAVTNKFDALNPLNWYRQILHNIMRDQVCDLPSLFQT